MVPRGIEPRYPVFQAGAYTHSAKAPFVDDKYWLILIFSSPNCIYHKQFFSPPSLLQQCEGSLLLPAFAKAIYRDPPSPRLRRVRADEERFELSTLPLTTGRSAIELFILVGLVRFELTTPRLKAGYICHLSYKPIFILIPCPANTVMTDGLEPSTFTVSA